MSASDNAGSGRKKGRGKGKGGDTAAAAQKGSTTPGVVPPVVPPGTPGTVVPPGPPAGPPPGGQPSSPQQWKEVVHHHPPKEMAEDVGYPVRGGQTLLIAYFPWEASEADIEKEFSRFCRVKRVQLVVDKSSKKPRCFGFVKFHTKADAEEALRATTKGLVTLPDTRGHVWHLKAEWTKSGDMVVDDPETEQEIAMRKEERRSRAERRGPEQMDKSKWPQQRTNGASSQVPPLQQPVPPRYDSRYAAALPPGPYPQGLQQPQYGQQGLPPPVASLQQQPYGQYMQPQVQQQAYGVAPQQQYAAQQQPLYGGQQPAAAAPANYYGSQAAPQPNYYGQPQTQPQASPYGQPTASQLYGQQPAQQYAQPPAQPYYGSQQPPLYSQQQLQSLQSMQSMQSMQQLQQLQQATAAQQPPARTPTPGAVGQQAVDAAAAQAAVTQQQQQAAAASQQQQVAAQQAQQAQAQQAQAQQAQQQQAAAQAAAAAAYGSSYDYAAAAASQQAYAQQSTAYSQQLAQQAAYSTQPPSAPYPGYSYSSLGSQYASDPFRQAPAQTPLPQDPALGGLGYQSLPPGQVPPLAQYSTATQPLATAQQALESQHAAMLAQQRAAQAAAAVDPYRLQQTQAAQPLQYAPQPQAAVAPQVQQDPNAVAQAPQAAAAPVAQPGTQYLDTVWQLGDLKDKAAPPPGTVPAADAGRPLWNPNPTPGGFGDFGAAGTAVAPAQREAVPQPGLTPQEGATATAPSAVWNSFDDAAAKGMVDGLVGDDGSVPPQPATWGQQT